MEIRKSATTMTALSSLNRFRAFALAWAASLLPCVLAHAETQSIESAANVLAEHAVAQQGLAIALASNVLQSHLLYVEVALGLKADFNGTCVALDPADAHSGGIEGLAPTPPPGTIPPLVHTMIFYDGTCTKKYMAADVALQDNGAGSYTVSNLLTQYFATDGMTPLVSLTTTATATLSNGGSSLTLHGIGSLTGPAHHNVAADLGLVCTTQDSGGNTVPNTLFCAGGVAQDFITLGAAIGSVSPLTLNLPASGSGRLTFASTAPAAFRSGAPGSLSLHYADASDSALTISGGSVYGSNQVSGEAGQFSLFPPPPTDWSSDDTAHDAHFSITVLSPSVRDLGLSITRISNGAPRGAASLDQSGTGTITFSDGSHAEVRGWIISDGALDAIFADGFELP